MTKMVSFPFMLFALGCGAQPEELVPGEGLGIDPGVAPMSRLNNTQYTNTIADVFDGMDVEASFPEENVVDSFDNNVFNASVSQVRADELFEAALHVGAAVAEDPEASLGCSPVDDACIDAFIQDYGQRLWRRPLDDEERANLRAQYDSTAGEAMSERVDLLLASLLMSPQFLFRPEIGEPDLAFPGVLPLTDYEIATRMSLLIWASTPDDALLAAAAADQLTTTAQIESQAWRMMDDPRARRGMANFLYQWADVRELATASKDAVLYPEFDPQMVESMMTELAFFLDRVVWEQDGSIVEILTSTQTTVDARLAAIYGVEHPGTDEWIDVTLPSDQRSGLLTQAAFLADKAHAIAPAPVRRGLFIRTAVMCQDIPAPPDDVDTSIPEPTVAETNRDRTEAHSADPSCSGCHQYMDPLGFAFENYDAIGAWRDTDNGFPVDATGEVVQQSGASTPFDGAVDMMGVLSAEEDVLSCMATHLFRYGYGRRADATGDARSMRQMRDASAASGGSLQAQMVALTLTDGFRFRRLNQDAQGGAR